MSLQKENRHQVFAESFMSFAAGLKEMDESHIRLLVVLATKNVESAPFVVKSIEEHLPKMKLPLLYLVDSLVKEIGDPYKSLFATNIGHSFSIVYQKVRRSKKSSMLELRQSQIAQNVRWTSILGPKIQLTSTSSPDFKWTSIGCPFRDEKRMFTWEYVIHGMVS